MKIRCVFHTRLTELQSHWLPPPPTGGLLCSLGSLLRVSYTTDGTWISLADAREILVAHFFFRGRIRDQWRSDLCHIWSALLLHNPHTKTPQEPREGASANKTHQEPREGKQRWHKNPQMITYKTPQESTEDAQPTSAGKHRQAIIRTHKNHPQHKQGHGKTRHDI